MPELATMPRPEASINTSMSQMTLAAVDDVAIQRAKTGDLNALEGVYRAYEGLVYNMARRICRTAEDAEDVLQETFVEVCRSMKNFRGTGPGSLTAWIKRVAASKALMRVRHEKYRDADELSEGTRAIGMRDPDAGLTLDLEAALERLSETARAVVWLHDVEGYKHEEIAELMGKTVSFSKSQLSRAHARLRSMLGEEVQC
jgi:RNA polymerase sigma-70 factor (ECF subfamily)